MSDLGEPTMRTHAILVGAASLSALAGMSSAQVRFDAIGGLGLSRTNGRHPGDEASAKARADAAAAAAR